MLLHIVYHKFKPHVTNEQIEKHYSTDLRLKERMPFILGWNFHTNVSLMSRADTNQGFTHGVIVYLKDEVDLQRYLADPQHLEVKEIQESLIEGVMVADFVDSGYLEKLFEHETVSAEVIVEAAPVAHKPAVKRKKPPAPPPAVEAAAASTTASVAVKKRKKIPVPPPAYVPAEEASEVGTSAATDERVDSVIRDATAVAEDVTAEPDKEGCEATAASEPKKPAEIAPLSLKELSGRSVMVPRGAILPEVVEEYGCDEQDGEGWAAKLLTVKCGVVTVKWTAKSGSWKGYKDYYKTKDVLSWKPLK